MGRGQEIMNATTPMIVNRSLLLVGLLLATSSCADTGVAAEAAPPAVETPAVVEEGTPAPEAPVDPPQEEEGTDHAEVVEDAAGAASAQPSSPQAEWTGATANCTAPGTSAGPDQCNHSCKLAQPSVH